MTEEEITAKVQKEVREKLLKELEAKRKAEEESRLKAEEETKRKAEEEKKFNELKLIALAESGDEKIMEEKANAGDADAMLSLGIKLLQITENTSKAISCLVNSYKRGLVLAAAFLAKAYSQGTKRDFILAFTWLQEYMDSNPVLRQDFMDAYHNSRSTYLQWDENKSEEAYRKYIEQLSTHAKTTNSLLGVSIYINPYCFWRALERAKLQYDNEQNLINETEEVKSNKEIDEYNTIIRNRNTLDTHTSIIIPEGITKINDDAFRNCKHLVSISMPNSLSSIGEDAFSGSSIITLEFPPSITIIPSDLCSSCESLTKVVLPSDLKFIERRAFQRCRNLRSVKIPEGTIRVGECAFNFCTSLVFVRLPNSLTILENGAFNHCDSLREVVIPNGLTFLEGAFNHCKNLTKITLPITIVNIVNSFVDDKCLKFINIPKGRKAHFMGISVIKQLVKDNKAKLIET